MRLPNQQEPRRVRIAIGEVDTVTGASSLVKGRMRSLTLHDTTMEEVLEMVVRAVEKKTKTKIDRSALYTPERTRGRGRSRLVEARD
jgi:hypothetical protein